MQLLGRGLFALELEKVAKQGEVGDLRKFARLELFDFDRAHAQC